MARKTIVERLKDSQFTFFENGDFEVKDAVIIFRNFEGRPTDLNKKGGVHTFSLVLPDDIGTHLQNLGWNIKIRTPKKEGDVPYMYTELLVGFNGAWPPDIRLITYKNDGTKRGRKLDELTIACLDKIFIESIDILVHPRKHDSHGYVYKGYANRVVATQARMNFFDGRYDDVDWDDEWIDTDHPEDE